MGAYQVTGVPIQWMGGVLAVFLVLVPPASKLQYRREYLYPAIVLLLVSLFSLAGFLFWGSVTDFKSLLPVGSTTDYAGFIFLRYFQFIVFLAVYLISITFLERHGLERLGRLITVCGVLVATYALYVYVAQIVGFPEIPRNRLGTGGEQQAVYFSYAFHRAMGSFREPSHLAEWLVIPFFMTLLNNSIRYLAARILLMFVILLTGSLTGIVATIAGYMLSLLAVSPLRKAIPRLVTFVAILAVATALFRIFASPYLGGSADLWAIILERLSPIIREGGLGGSNRAYVYEFVAANPFPLIGYGLGNGNILFGDSLGLGLTASFLSLYVNMLYALGFAGVWTILVFLLVPVIALFRFKTGNLRYLRVLVGSYLAWLLIYSAHAEELSASFAILYAACIHYYVTQKLKRRRTKANTLPKDVVNAAHGPTSL